MSCAESPVPRWGGWWSGLQSALTLCSPAFPLHCFANVVWLPAEGSGGVNFPPNPSWKGEEGRPGLLRFPGSLNSAFLLLCLEPEHLWSSVDSEMRLPALAQNMVTQELTAG